MRTYTDTRIPCEWTGEGDEAPASLLSLRDSVLAALSGEETGDDRIESLGITAMLLHPEGDRGRGWVRGGVSLIIPDLLGYGALVSVEWTPMDLVEVDLVVHTETSELHTGPEGSRAIWDLPWMVRTAVVTAEDEIREMRREGQDGGDE